MATCQHRQFLAPNEATTCPRCHAPFYAVSQFSIYKPAQEAAMGPAKDNEKKKPIMIGTSVLLIVLLGFFVLAPDSAPIVAKRSRKEPTDVQQTTVFQAFVPADAAFRVRMTGKPARSEVVDPALGYSRPLVYYTVEYQNVAFQIEQRVVPRYVPAYERDQALIEWFPVLTPEDTYTIESTKPVQTPAGDPAFDAVLIDKATGSMCYQRMVSWSGNILTLSATWPAGTKPDTELIKSWNTMSDSIKHR